MCFYFGNCSFSWPCFILLTQRFVKITAHDESEPAHVSDGNSRFKGYRQQTFTAVINLTELQIFYTDEAAGR